MILAAFLALLVVGGSLLLPPPVTGAAVPDTPGATMLPEVVTYEAIVAEVDGDGAPDIVRLVDGGNGAIDVEAWRVGADRTPELIGQRTRVTPPDADGEPGELVYVGTPHRLLARRIDGVVRATLVQRPRFEEPALEVDCCILLHDIVARGDAIELTDVAEPGQSADAVLAIDLDGDDTDELLVTRGLAPLGQTTYPTDARVLRWDGTRFGAPTVTALGVGSGFSPFVLGDTDGLPGDEAAFIAAESRLHRVSLRSGDVLVAESAEAGTRSAMAVPIGSGRGIATVSVPDGTSVRPWPRDGPLGSPVGSTPIHSGSIVGGLGLEGASWLAVKRRDSPEPVLLSLPALDEASDLRGLGAGEALADSPAPPYVGRAPGADQPSVVALGSALAVGSEVFADAPLAGVRAVGLAGPDRGWLVLWHGDWLGPGAHPPSGLLYEPQAQAGSGVSVVPLSATTVRQRAWVLDPDLDGTVADGQNLVVAASGFGVEISAPPGSRLYVANDAGERDVGIVGGDGVLEMRIDAPADPGPGGPRVELALVTPAGRGYTAAWGLRVLSATPPLEVRAHTPMGSAAVTLRGTTVPGATLTVQGNAVEVGADGRFRTQVTLPPWPSGVEVVTTDQLGNSTRTEVVGVGWFDYRGLPWIAVAVVGVAAAGGLLVVRGARVRPAAAPSPDPDTGTLEELDEDAVEI